MESNRTLAVAVAALVVGSVVGGAAVGALGNGPDVSTDDPAADDGTDPNTPDDRATTTPADPPNATATSGSADVEQFDSAAAFRRYLEQNRAGPGRTVAVREEAVDVQRSREMGAEGNGNGNGGAAAGDGGSSTAPEPADQVQRQRDSEAGGRHSSTNVQEQGIDEPDILKTTGSHLYYARGPVGGAPRARPAEPRADSGTGVAPPMRRAVGETYVFDTDDPATPERIATINGSGRLLQTGDRLVAIRRGRLVGYDVSRPSDPREVWSRPLNGTVETARLHDGTVYLVTRTPAAPDTPCPIRPLGGPDGAIPCSEIYHPRGSVDVDATYSAFAIAPADGTVRETVSFVGSARNSVIYMSANALYVTYTERTDRTEQLIGALSMPAVDAPERVIDRLRQVQSYDLTPRAERIEIEAVVDNWLNGLPEERRSEKRRDIERASERYVRNNRRKLTTTGIVRVEVGGGLSVSATGSVPGVPLDQFSMDEHDGRLRIATTIPRQRGTKSENDLYVLNATGLSQVGAVEGMGLDQRVYAVRYVGETAYVVTFRRVDPFHVVDLSDPTDPTEVGTLKLPGFSSYLHPIDDSHVLGIGREDGEVKTVLFDVSDPSNPTIDDTYFPEASWSAISATHRAFLLDRRHGVFFLPGSDGGYVIDYTEGDLSKAARIDTDGSATRAAYVDDYMYVFSDRGMAVVDERNWTVVNRTRFGRTFEGPAGVFQTFMQDLASGDAESAAALVHPDSPLADESWLTDGETVPDFDVTVHSARVQSRTESTVRLDSRVTTSFGGRTSTTRATVVLRRHDGQWKIWQIRE